MFYLSILLVLMGSSFGRPQGISTKATNVAAAPNCPLLGGCESWSSTYNNPADGLDTSRNFDYAVQSIALSPDGTRVFEIGESWGGDPPAGGTQYDFLVIAHDALTGARIWTARYNGPGNSQDQPLAISLSPNGGRVFVTGISVGDGTSFDYATLAYDAATGAELWASRYNGPGNAADWAWSLVLSPDGHRVFVTGFSWGGSPSAGTHYDYATVAYDATTGMQLWASRYNGPGNSEDRARSIAVTPDGARVFVTGKSVDLNVDYATAAYDASNGTQLWVSLYDGAVGYDEAIQVLAEPNGSSLYVTGYSEGVGTNSDYATISYDPATGAQRWATRYSSGTLLAGNVIDNALGMAVSTNSRVYVTGYSNNDYATVAYDGASGTQQWVARFNGNGPALNETDEPYALVVSPDNSRVYLTGTTFRDDNHYDIGTIAYDAVSGAQQWMARFDGTEHFQDAAFGIALSSDGSNLFVQGESWHNGTPGVGDLATIAYLGVQPPLLKLDRVVSCKIHGGGGAFDINLPLSAPPAIECRSGGANGDYTLVFTFSTALNSVEGASVTNGAGTVSSRKIDINNPHQYIVDVTDVTPAQPLTLRLTNVQDTFGNALNSISTSLMVLIGDTNGDGSVNSADIAQTKSQSGQSVRASNFREDLTTDGNLNSADIALAKSKSGTGL